MKGVVIVWLYGLLLFIGMFGLALFTFWIGSSVMNLWRVYIRDFESTLICVKSSVL